MQNKIVLHFDNKPKKLSTQENMFKLSLNEWYAGRHWTYRVKVKDIYINSIYKQVQEQPEGHLGIFKFLDLKKPLEMTYEFEFENRPLDCSNCIAMVKLIEDILLQGNDSYNQILSLKISSKKGDTNKLTISWQPACIAERLK